MDAAAALAQAQATGQETVVGTATTNTLIQYAEPDGTFRAEMSSGPVRERDLTAPSGWSPIDTTLISDEAGIHPRLTDAQITISSGPGIPLVTMARDGRTIGLDWPSPLPPPTLAGATATYNDVLANLDLTVAALPAGYETSLVLRAPPASAPVFDFPLITGDLTPVLDEGGRLSLLDPAGVVVASTDPSLMWDATVGESGEPLHHAVVKTELIHRTDGTYALRVSPDRAFLAAPDTVYPVTLDPTSSYSVSSDTQVRDDTPTTSYGSNTALKIGTPDGVALARTLIRFANMQGLLYKQIDSATLSLYQVGANTCTATEFDLYEAADEFTDSTTWDTQPPVGAMFASATAAKGYRGVPPGPLP